MASEALEAQTEIEAAQIEYGNTFTLRKFVGYTQSPSTGYGATYTDNVLKAFVRKEATKGVQSKIDDSISNYELVFMFYTSLGVTKEDSITYGGKEYKILYISESSLQDTTYKYEVLVAKA